MPVILTVLALALNALAMVLPSQAIHLVWVALLLAAFLAYMGEMLGSAVAWAVTLFNAVFLSQGVRAMLIHGWTASEYFYPVVTASCFLLPLMCWIAASRRTA